MPLAMAAPISAGPARVAGEQRDGRARGRRRAAAARRWLFTVFCFPRTCRKKLMNPPDHPEERPAEEEPRRLGAPPSRRATTRAAAKTPTEATRRRGGRRCTGPPSGTPSARFESPSSSSSRRSRSSGVTASPPALPTGFSCEYREEGRNRIAVPPCLRQCSEGRPAGYPAYARPRRRPSGRRATVGVDVVVGVGDREEGRLELGRRQVDAVLEHARGRSSANFLVSALRALAASKTGVGGEEDRDHRADPVHLDRHPGRRGRPRRAPSSSAAPQLPRAGRRRPASRAAERGDARPPWPAGSRRASRPGRPARPARSGPSRRRGRRRRPPAGRRR